MRHIELTLAVLFKSSNKAPSVVHAEHARGNNPSASQNSRSCKGFCAQGQTGPDVITPQRAGQDKPVSVFKDIP